MRSSALFPSQRLARWHLTVPLALFLVILAATPLTQRIDLWFYDALITRAPLAPADDLLLVAIDEKSLEALGRWPWPRSYHAQLIEQLNEAGSGPIAIDILFTEPSQNAADDRRLARAMAEHGQVILPVHIFPAGEGSPLREFLPTAPLTRAAAALGHVHVELDEDGLARGFYRREGLGEALWPSLADATAQQAGHELPAMREPRASVPSAFVNVREQHVRIPFAGTGAPLPRVSYVDIIENRVPAEELRGRVIMVGATAAGFGDLLPTPVSGRAHPLNGVEFHANAYSALVQDRLIRPTQLWPVLLLGALAIVIISWQFPRMRAIRTFWLATALTLLPVGLSWILLRTTSLWLPPAAPALTAVIAFPLWTTERLALLSRFLNRQLDALGREPRVTVGRPEGQPPAQLLAHLAELTGATDTWLVTDGVPVRGQVPEHPYMPGHSPQPGKWKHERNRSWIRFHRHGHWHEIGLYWPSSGPSEACTGYLNRLRLHSGSAEPIIQRSGERLSRRIEEVSEATNALASMRQFIGTGFERMPDGVVVTDALGVIRFTNAHVAEWFAMPRESLIGMPLLRLLENTGSDDDDAPRSSWQDRIISTLRQGATQSIGYRVGQRDLLIHLAPFTLPDHYHYGAIANFADITDLRERQRQYREAIDFISHDMRSPLVSQLALLDQLKRSQRTVEPQDLDQIARLARRSYQLAEEFVQLARAEQLTEKRFYECELLTIAENAVDAVQEQAHANRIMIRLEGEENLWLFGNAELLERAVINLLTNAIQYSPGDTEVAVHVRRANDRAVLSVSDQGPGIAPEDQPQVFKRFRRQKDVELSGKHGAGLGLTFVRTVAEKHRGAVDLTSTPGRGSTFRLYLPLEG